MAENLKVAVRVRPFNEREISMNAICCINMIKETQQTIITDPTTSQEKTFTFDYSYDSFISKDSPEFASQETVWNDLGVKVLDHAWEGFNVSLFAYGQTGSGKSYSMVGYGEDKGIVPRVCEEIFQRINESPKDSDITFKVEASMMEIYNEKVKDLLNPSMDNLKVRDHPKQGPYAEGLTKNVVNSYNEINLLMDSGIMARTTASTNMNATSSRAHTIFNVILTQSEYCDTIENHTDKISCISLIDLAGSERAASTGATGGRLKEGAAINQSLSALGNVISALADNALLSKKKLVPYRNSKLTHLLKDSLGGNAKSIMIAALSPASVNYSETLSTLRYADRAKQIKNQAVVNEDANKKLIRELKEEVDALRKAMQQSSSLTINPENNLPRDENDMELLRIKEKLEENERLLHESEKTWIERIKETERLAKKREEVLISIGLAVNVDEIQKRSQTDPYMMNLNEDKMMTEKLLYFFHEGENKIGRNDSKAQQDIVLGGLGIQKEHCEIKLQRIKEDLNVKESLVIIPKADAKVYVNGKLLLVNQEYTLCHLDRLILGTNNVFKMIIPSSRLSDTKDDSIYDWQYAMKELNATQNDLIQEKIVEQATIAEKQRCEMEIKIQTMEERIKLEKAISEETINKQKQEWQQQVINLREEMASKEIALRKQMEAENNGKVDQAKLATLIAEHEAALAKKLAQVDMEYETKQRELSEKHKQLEDTIIKQMDETRKKEKKKEREMRERQLLDDELLKIIPLVNEVNSMSDELKKGILFGAKLFTTSPSNVQLANNSLTTESLSDSIDAELCVLMSYDDYKDKTPIILDIETFYNIYFLIQQMYQKYQENNKSLLDKDEPLVFNPPSQKIGYAFVSLEALAFGVEIAEKASILNSSGDIIGTILSNLTIQVDHPKWENWNPIQDNCDSKEIDVILPSLDCFLNEKATVRIEIPKAEFDTITPGSGTYVYINWLDGLELYTSDQCDSSTKNPIWNFQVCFEYNISSEFIQYIKNGVVEILIYGCNIIADASNASSDIVFKRKPIKQPSTNYHRGLNDDKINQQTFDALTTRNNELEAKIKEYEEALHIQEKTLIQNTQEREYAMEKINQLTMKLKEQMEENEMLRSQICQTTKQNDILKDKVRKQVLIAQDYGCP